MHGRPESAALGFIKANTRKRRAETEAQPSSRHASEDSDTNPDCIDNDELQAMSADNKVLFDSLERYINVQVTEKISGHLQSLNDKLDFLLERRLDTVCSIDAPEQNGPRDQRASDCLRASLDGNQPQWWRSSTSSTTGSVLGKLEQAEEEAADEKETAILDKLVATLEKAETFYEEAAERAVEQKFSCVVEDMPLEKKDSVLDIVVAIIIVMNAVVIGISMDNDAALIEVIDVCFTACFVIELFIKFYLHGFIGHFSHAGNIFDFLIVAADLLQLSLELMQVDVLSDAPAASMFRVARLVRLVRLIRLARLEMLDDLVALVSGMVGGMTTLLWCLVLFLLILYITALLFRECFGRTSHVMPSGTEDMTLYFTSVPRCMLTVFRFFFGDFTTISGWSMFEGIQHHYGALAAVFVCTFFFIITIGLFNVIAAIFVESTLAAANNTQIGRKIERMNDDILWATRLSLLVRKIFEYNGTTLPQKASQALESVCDQAIPEEVFQNYIKDPTVVKALNDLEIDQSDHKYLFDILDNDNTGSIFISQLSDGLERLRGDPRRSDIICVDLMVRAIQHQTDFLVQAAKANVKTSSKTRKMSEESSLHLQRIEEILLRIASGDVDPFRGYQNDVVGI